LAQAALQEGTASDSKSGSREISRFSVFRKQGRIFQVTAHVTVECSVRKRLATAHNNIVRSRFAALHGHPCRDASIMGAKLAHVRSLIWARRQVLINQRRRRSIQVQFHCRAPLLVARPRYRQNRAGSSKLAQTEQSQGHQVEGAHIVHQ
jgi:hypothetical protein